MRNNFKRLTVVLLAAVLLTGCGAAPVAPRADGASTQSYITGADLIEIQDEAVALAATPAAQAPVASGTAEKKTDKAVIDYSNIADGYVMVKFTAATSVRLKAQVKGPSGLVYSYDLPAGKWVVFPLSDGNGSYTVTVFQNTTGSKYATVTSVTFSASLKNEFAPFLMPNQYVNYTDAPKTVAKAKELVKGVSDPLEQIRIVYEYTVDNIVYDKKQADTVKSGYLPVLDTVLAKKKGICFDYAAMMTAMLRSQGVPCKLVVGFAGTAYHAWVNVYTVETGWVNAAVFVDGTSWNLMDPTFASSGKQSEDIMKYIGDGSNYTAKYIY